MSQPMRDAIAGLRTAMNTFCDALDAEVAARWKAPLPAGTPAAAPAEPKRQPRRATPTLPPDIAPPARNPATVLSDETRKASMADARHIVQRMQDAGIAQTMWRDGLRGQLAKECIPFDEQVITDTLAAFR